MQSDVSYVMMFGQSKSAKSTVLATMAWFIQSAPGYQPDLNAVGNRESAKTLKVWVRGLENGEFPGKTALTTVQRIDIGFDRSSLGERRGFSFLEIAGENVVRLDPLHDSHELAVDELRPWLNKTEAIVLTASAEPVGGNLYDDCWILQAFLEFVRSDRRLDKLPILLLLTEWDRVAKTYPDWTSFARQHFFPVLKILKARRERALSDVMTFCVGDVEDDRRRIRKLDVEGGVRKLVSWLASSTTVASNDLD